MPVPVPVRGWLASDGRVQVLRAGVLALTGMSESTLKRREGGWGLATTVKDGRGTKLYFVEDLVALRLCSVEAAAAVVVPGRGFVQDAVLELRSRNDVLAGECSGLRMRVAELEAELRGMREQLRDRRLELDEKRQDIERLHRVVELVSGGRA